MNKYIDIKIKPDAEMQENELLNKTFTKLHKALWDLNADSIGVSFPDSDLKLGRVIRLHSSENSLKKLQDLNWLGGLSGYCEVSRISTVPEKVKGYRCISRRRKILSKSKLKRLIKRNSISEEDVKKYKAKMFSGGLCDSYMELLSVSTGEKYRLYISFGKILEKPKTGKFNRFGLSNVATVPIF